MEKQTEVHHLGPSAADDRGTYVVLGGAGALVLGLAPLLASWLSDVPFVPFGAVLDWVGGFDDPWTWFARPAVGLVIGVALARLDIGRQHRLEVGPDAVVVVRGGDRRRLDRTSITGIYREGRTVVIDGLHGRRLFSATLESTTAQEVRAAFTAHGYPYESE